MKKILIPSLLLFATSLSFGQGVGINNSGANPANSAMLDVVATDKGILVPRVALTATNAAGPITAPATSLLVYNTVSAGAGATAVTPGFYYWDGAAWQRFDVGNNTGDWKILGNANTTSGTNFLGTTNGQALDFRTNNIIRFRVANGNQVHAMSNGTAALPFYTWGADTDIGMYRRTTNELNFATAGTEALRITPTQRLQGVNGNNGTPTFSFINDPNTGMYSAVADQLNWSTGGAERLRLTNTQLATTFLGATGAPAYSFTGDLNTGMWSSTADHLNFSTNSQERLELGTTAAVFNEGGLDYDFRFESDNNTNVMRIDAGNDVVRFGSNTGALSANGLTLTSWDGFNLLTVDYVADFDNGATTGTTIGIGSIEYLADFSSEIILGNASFSPSANLTYDLGSPFTNFWDDVFADDYWIFSDTTLKKDITPIHYGLKEILKINPITYLLKEDPFQEQKIGLSAQELQNLITESVKTYEYRPIDEDPKNGFEKIEIPFLAVNYTSLVPVLIQALKEEDAKVVSLEKRIEELEKIILTIKK